MLNTDVKDAIQRRMAKRDDLYWNYRYRKGSYKAKKMGLQPILIMARRGGDMIRVYGETDEPISPTKLAFAAARFKVWGQKERKSQRLSQLLLLVFYQT